MIEDVNASTGWLIVQRELTGSVRVVDAPDIWITVVFSTPSRMIAGSNAAPEAGASLVDAVQQALRAPAPGAPPDPPAAVMTAPALVGQVQEVLRGEGIAVSVDEVVPPDWAEDVLTELTGHLAGRLQVADPPMPEEWALLHQQAAAYAQARPWERRGDDVHLRLELKTGSTRADAVAIVLGNAGVTLGLALCPGREVPPAIRNWKEEMPPPEGTIHFSLIGRHDAPPEMLERAERYGWPPGLDHPLFLAVGPDGPQEIGREQAVSLTVALAAAVEHDRQGAGFGMNVRGELILASGRRGRYSARLEPNVALDIPPGLKLFSGEVRNDLLPEGTIMGLGGLPWEELPWVRSHARRQLAPQLARPPAGDALPVLILGLEEADGDRVANALYSAHPEGVALLDVDDDVLVVILTDGGMHGVTDLPAGDVSIARFRRRLVATQGWHGIVVSTPTGERGDPIYGFFECVLAQLPGRGIAPTVGGRAGRLARRGRKVRRGR
jgi:hypothetical protein